MQIGKTFDELDSFVGNPSNGSYIAIRDMSLGATDPSATKKFTVADLIVLIQSVKDLYMGQQVLLANVPKLVTFPEPFASTPEVSVLKTLVGGVHMGIAVDISLITFDTFTATAIEDCTLIYLAGNITT